jgi:hypothetical protein
MMNEYIRTIFLLNEAKAFAVIKPLHDSISHSDILLSNNFHVFRLKDVAFDKWTFPLERKKPAHKGKPS